jgi:iron complex outermembrane receptor protein
METISNRKFCVPLSKSQRAVLLPVSLLGLGLSAPVVVQAQTAAVVEEVIVSARRQEESSQEIPISITVVDQEALANANVFSAVDLKQFAPSLAVNTRFGPDQASFAIRGFTQELRTTPSVGFYFAEVVAPRGGNSVTSGDGAGPGTFFDLQNVVVLKGPQGTLFGRNTTGGAILVTPQEPTSALEGYVEGTVGNYDMRRVQGVLNVPLGDTVRTRFGIDTLQRDGYLDNISGIGPKDLNDADYIAARASVIWDITDTVENYTIATYADSKNNGNVNRLIGCFSQSQWYSYSECTAQLARQGDNFYAVESIVENPTSELKQWQVINKTSWSITDEITLKNILSYADLYQLNRTAVYGVNFGYPSPGPGNGRYGFTESNQPPGNMPTNSQASFVEELQLQGYAFDQSLNWTVGLYFESSKPDGDSGSQSINALYCATYDRNDPGAALCANLGTSTGRQGGISRTIGTIEYETKAAYSEATYDITDQWKVTAGLRYTHDEVRAIIKDARVWRLHSDTPNPPTRSIVSSCIYNSKVAILSELGLDACRDTLGQTSEAFTGQIDFDYFPTDEVMLYAKFARGYRMGALNMFGGDPYRTYEPETVDASEIGAKTEFGGPVPGTFNVSAFYNELRNQQLQLGYVFLNGSPPSTGIYNAGQSIIRGVELESTFMLLEDLQLKVSYTYLDAMLRESIPPIGQKTTLGPSTVYIIPTVAITSPSSVEREHLTFSPRHSVVVGLDYRLPLSAEVGDITIGALYSYTDSQLSTAPGSPFAELPAYEIVNFNANWRSIFGSGFDAGLFVTNAFDEEYFNYVPGNYSGVGIEVASVGVPRMWGGKIRYNF